MTPDWNKVMGIEYIAHTRAQMTPEQTVAFVSEFVAQPDWYVLQRDSHKISFLFSGTKPRPNGPEDFRLEISDGEVYIVFYGGTRAQENHVMAFIRHSLSSKGVDIELEEP